MKLPRDVEKRVLELADAQQPVAADTLCFRLPLPPSTNALFASVLIDGKPRRVKTTIYKDWLKEAGLVLKGHVASPVVIELVVCGAVSEARDLDNFIKATCDALTSCGVIGGDSLRHVRRLVLDYSPSAAEPCVQVTVRRII